MEKQKKYDGWLQQSSQEEDSVNFFNLNHFIQGRQILELPYSLQPDMVSGWMPKTSSSPIPLVYLSEEPILNDEKIIYRGHRFSNSVQLHQSYGYKWKYRGRYQLKKNYFTQINTKSQKIDMQKYQQKQNIQKLHNTVNIQLTQKEKEKKIQKCTNLLNTQLIKLEKNHSIYHFLQNNDQFLLFDSKFQCANLDFVAKNHQGSYNCYVRCDTNTKGHTNWYYFRVKCKIKGSYVFNICNLTKKKNLYNSGMTPYIRKRILNLDWSNWSQQLCYNVNFKHKQQKSILQFMYDFQQNEQIEISYSIPYSFSDLQRWIAQIKLYSNIKVFSLCQSLSGLQLPCINISNQKNKNKNKKVAIISARIHPGQTNSSHMIQGLVMKLLQQSQQTKLLLNQIQFYVIPMMNPDGVVVGNFRTSFSGRDLNRQFLETDKFYTPQINGLIQLVKKLKKQNKKIQYFFDFHSHSSKKGLFAYGPQFKQKNSYFLKSKMFIKILSNKSNMFQESQTNFYIHEKKKNTGRAYMLRAQNILFTYTFEISNGFYIDKTTSKKHLLNITSLHKAGCDIFDGMINYLKIQRYKDYWQKSIRSINKQIDNQYFLLQQYKSINTKNKTYNFLSEHYSKSKSRVIFNNQKQRQIYKQLDPQLVSCLNQAKHFAKQIFKQNKNMKKQVIQTDSYSQSDSQSDVKQQIDKLFCRKSSTIKKVIDNRGSKRIIVFSKKDINVNQIDYSKFKNTIKRHQQRKSITNQIYNINSDLRSYNGFSLLTSKKNIRTGKYINEKKVSPSVCQIKVAIKPKKFPILF